MRSRLHDRVSYQKNLTTTSSLTLTILCTCILTFSITLAWVGTSLRVACNDSQIHTIG
jgi:hypothetical protein